MTTEIITSKSNNKFKNLIKFFKNTDALNNKFFITDDILIIKKADKLNLLSEVYSNKKTCLKCNNVLLSDELISKLTNKGIVGIINIKTPAEEYKNKIVYLEEISDPSNLGKIIYLMNKFKYKTLFISPNSVSIYNQKCLEIARENIFDVDVFYKNLSDIKKLKNDYQIISTSLRTDNLLNEFKPKEKFIITFGNESRGISKELENISSDLVKIKIDNIDSLNISIACSIILNRIK